MALFSKVRDEWIAEDLDGWLAPNRIYEGVAAPVKQSMGSNEVYVVTTKGVRCGAIMGCMESSAMFKERRFDLICFTALSLKANYTEILLRDMAGIQFPADRIFSQTVSGRPKV